MIKQLVIAICLLLAGCKGNSQQKDTSSAMSSDKEKRIAINKSDEEWRKELTDMEYYVLRKSGTENPGSSKLLYNKEKGSYVCAACGTPLFRSETKFDSGTGWPSFFDTVGPDVVEIRTDSSHGMVREEAVCANCGAHLGHRFPDGPGPTGARYCMNSASLRLDRDEVAETG